MKSQTLNYGGYKQEKLLFLVMLGILNPIINNTVQGMPTWKIHMGVVQILEFLLIDFEPQINTINHIFEKVAPISPFH